MSEIDLKKFGRTREFKKSGYKRVAILFSGGPAPGANAVIASATLKLLNQGYDVLGMYRGYENLMNFDKLRHSACMRENEHYVNLTYDKVTRIRHLGGSIIGTSRANPARVGSKDIKKFEDFGNPEMTQYFDKVLDALEYLHIDSLISIGGDDTLKTAYYMSLLGVPVVHVPKTIDNDYYGIAWTFGYFSAIERARQDLIIFNQETKTTQCYFVLEMMGRKAGWYTMGAGIAGSATKILIPEEITGTYDIDKSAAECVDIILQREKMGKKHGLILISEGLADLLTKEKKQALAKTVDEHGNIKLADLKIGEQLALAIKTQYQQKTGKKLNLKNDNIGYTTRTIEPTAFDVLLASQLGMGASRFIINEQYGLMASVGEELRISHIPFSELIDKKTLKVRQRFVDLNSDFYELGRSLQFESHFMGSSGD